MKKIVITGSVSLQKKVAFWRKFWEEKNCTVIDYPSAISEKTFLKDYSDVFRKFFENIIHTDILFVMNENKNLRGYIGAQSFAEICFAVAQNQVYNRGIEIILFQMPEKKVQSYEEVLLWLKLGWIKLFKED